MIRKLIPFELKKIVSEPILMVMTAIMLIASISLVAYTSYSPPTGIDRADYMSYFDSVYDMAKNDPETFLKEYDRITYQYYYTMDEPSTGYGGGKYEDAVIFEHVYEVAMADRIYHEKAGEIVAMSDALRMSYEKMGIGGDSYYHRYQVKVAARYKYLDENVRLGDKSVVGWYDYFGYNADYFIVMMLVSVISVYSALGDRTSGFYQIAGTCECGRARSVAAKYISASVVSAAVSVVFTVVSFAAVGVASGGYSDFTVGAQSTDVLELLPFCFSFGGALLFDMLLKAVTAVIFCSVVFAFAVIIKNVAVGVGIGVGLTVIGYIVPNTPETMIGQWKYLSPWSTYYISQFASRYRAVNIAGYPVSLGVVLVAQFIIVAAVSLLVSAAFYPARGRGCARRRRAGELFEKIKDRLPKRRKRHGSTSIFFSEVYKQRFVYAALAVIIVLKIVTVSSYYSSGQSAFDSILKEYLEDVGGPYTYEKAKYIRAEYEDVTETINMLQNIGDDYWNNKIPSETYNAILIILTEAQMKEQPLRYLNERSTYLEYLYEERGIVGSYVYDRGYYKFMDAGVDWLLLLFVCVLSCRMYQPEFAKGSSGGSMLMISNTTEHGRSYLFRRKLLICTVSSAAAWCIFRAIDLYFFLGSDELPGNISAPAMSMPRYKGSVFNLSIAGKIIVTIISSLAGTLVIAMLCFCLGLLLKRALYVYAAAAIIAAVPYFISQTGVKAAGYIDITALYDSDRLYRLSPGEMAIPIYGAIFFAAFITAAIGVTACISCKIKKGKIT